MNKKIIVVIIAGLLLRALFILFFSDLKQDYYWEYGEIAKNVIHGKGYSLFYFENGALEHLYTPEAVPFPSAYMPPGYVWTLVPFLLIRTVPVRNILFLAWNLILSAIIILLMYRYTLRCFGPPTALISALITAVLPEFLYACVSPTPTLVFQLLALLILILSQDAHGTGKSVLLGAAIAVSILFRAEMALFWLLFSLLFMLEKRLRTVLVSSAVVMLVLSPWSVRNTVRFGRFFPLTTSAGLNLYRGNNAYGIGDWGDEAIMQELRKCEGPQFEARMDSLYTKKALAEIAHSPGAAAGMSLVKLFNFWCLNISDRRVYTRINYIPAALFSILFFWGAIASFSWKRHKMLSLFYLFASLLMIAFFPLPRYITMMKIVLVPFAAVGFCRLYARLFSSRQGAGLK